MQKNFNIFETENGIRHADRTNRMIQATKFTRNKIKNASKLEQISHTGIYFLFGSDEQDQPLVYIGEGENCLKRINSHNKEKDFWSECVVVSTKTNDLTKTDVKYLEHKCLNANNNIGRYKAENTKNSDRPSISINREIDLIDYFETLSDLLSILGYPIFDDNENNKKQNDVEYEDDQQNFHLKSKHNGVATGNYTNEGKFVVLKGSGFAKETTHTFKQHTLRENLIKNGTLIEKDGNLILTQNYHFKSPSQAGCFVKGMACNGWRDWINDNGQTIDEVFRN